MKHIHPFPARMAPEIALDKVQTLIPGQTVLDPMTGSGMVLSQAVRSGINAIGIDLDPLAELISKVGARSVDTDEAVLGLERILQRSKEMDDDGVALNWIDDDLETTAFIDFWFAPKQKMQLRKLIFQISQNPENLSNITIDAIKVALSRLIITKEPKASLARDTAHSRPHRTILENDFDVFGSMPSSLRHVLSVLNSSSFKANVTTCLGDARDLSSIEDGEIDRIITSPPYLNAIDYMRGHRLSLVWLGYRLNDLRKIRGTSIGAEKAMGTQLSAEFMLIIDELKLTELSYKNKQMLDRYFRDLVQQTKEAHRVLKGGSTATYVVGNSTIKGVFVQNSEILKHAATLAGFELTGEVERYIPDNRRYMPMIVNTGNSLASRMRTEHVIDFRKCA